MDKKKWLRKLNIVDYFVVIVIIAIIVGFAFKGGIWDKISTASVVKENVTVTLLAEDFDSRLFDFIHKGDKVFDTENGVEIGQISEITKADYLKLFELPNGKIVSVAQPDRINLYITITSKAAGSNDGCYINGRYIGSNSPVNLSTKYVQFSSIVTKVVLEK